MKLVSWNVNGIRACMNKGFADFFNFINADIFCIQETKMQEGQAVIEFPGYLQYWNSAIKKGYSGTAIFTRLVPISIYKGIGIEEFDNEGRSITLEFDKFFLVNVYSPNSQSELGRIDYRMKWEVCLRVYLSELETVKPVILCGDLNVAHQEIDIKSPKPNIGKPGFSFEERGKFSELLEAGFIDTFRHMYPEKENAYTWWSYMFHAREKNVGWRIDYFVASEKLSNKIFQADIYNEIMGSDHCPVGLSLDVD